MNWNNVFAITKKDLLEVQQNKSVWVPMVVVPLVFILIFPLALLLIPSLAHVSPEQMMQEADLDMFLNNMPPTMTQMLQGLTGLQPLYMIVLGYIFAPFFLIFPLMFSTIIASESFAGERERKTLEALLYSPATDAELFTGKVLAGVIPAVLISWGSFLGYVVVTNAGGWSEFGRLWFPLPSWYPLIFWITPALAVFGVSVTVLISTRVQTFMGAYQMSASTVILVLGLLVGQLTGVLYLSVGVGLVLGLILWIIDLVLTVLAVRTFNRAKLLASAS